MLPPWAQDPSEEREIRTEASDASAGALVNMSDLVREQAGSIVDVGMALLELARAGLGSTDDPLIAPLTCPSSVITGRITAQRRFATQTIDLDRVKALAKAADCTVNDVILCVCSSALRRFLGEIDALPEIR